MKRRSMIFLESKKSYNFHLTPDHRNASSVFVSFIIKPNIAVSFDVFQHLLKIENAICTYG